MKRSDTLKRLEMPNANVNNEYISYEKRMYPRTYFETAELRSFYLQRETEILTMIEKEAWDYLVDFGAWDVEPGESFPCADEMTGEWYAADISFHNSGDQISGVIYMHFLGYYPPGCARTEIDDYLGMEAYFEYDQNLDMFAFDCFNTDAI